MTAQKPAGDVWRASAQHVKERRPTMGTRIYTTVAPFAVHDVWTGEHGDYAEAPHAIGAWYAYQEQVSAQRNAFYRTSGTDDQPLPVFELYGWVADVLSGAHGDLTPDVFRKGDLVVFAENESIDAPGGEIKLAFFADDRESLETFLRDWALAHELEYIKSLSAVVCVS